MKSPARPRSGDDPGLRSSLRKWQWAGAGVFLLLVVSFPIYRAVESTRREEFDTERQAALIANGRVLWETSCAACHGLAGEGVDAPALNSREFLTTATDGQIHHIVAAGVPGTEMGAWWNELGGPLTDEQILAVVTYLRSWEPNAPSRPDWRTPGGAHDMAPSEEHAEEAAEHMEEAGETPAAELDHGPVTITVTDRGCRPLELEVEAGREFTLRYVSEASEPTSLDLASLGQHLHADPGESVSVMLVATQEGEYPFECLGTAHGDLLGAGVITAL